MQVQGVSLWLCSFRIGGCMMPVWRGLYMRDVDNGLVDG
jgi:hypothetical protein